ncbi:MAG: helix-turn-helix transcriptional regulator [Erysipelotrichales bacterium]|nr:helix-turn-helix transcriptional regulator [Erysipelotrichales bacterium]
MDEKMDQKKTGQFIAELRKAKGLTQQQLADKLYIGREAVSKWERGVGYPGITFLLDLSEEFDVSVNEILYGERITEENKEEVEKAALTLYDRTRKKVTKLRKLILISVLAFIFIYFVSYFFYNYNSIHVYITNSPGENFIIDQGIILAAKDQLYFKLGNINNLTGEEINNIDLLYKDKDEYIRILNVDQFKEVIIDLNEYQSITKNKTMSKVLDDLYVEIRSDNIKDIQKLDVRLDYKNDFLFTADTIDEGMLDNTDYERSLSNTNNYSIYKAKEKFKLKNGEYIYNFKYDDKTYKCIFEEDVISCDDGKTEIIYDFSFDVYTFHLNKEKTIFSNKDNTCISGECNKVKNIIKIFEDNVLN